jgi:hypothetical protein
MVVKIANNSKFFTFMRDCKGDKKIFLGDARLKLQEAPSKRYGIMLMDAYSSDSLPVHLLTKEAMAMYLDKLDDNGIIAFHITNRHLDLKPVLAQFAQDFKLSAYMAFYDDAKRTPEYNLHSFNRWVLLSKNKNIFNFEKSYHHGLWKPIDLTKKILWTDNYSSIYSVLR